MTKKSPAIATIPALLAAVLATGGCNIFQRISEVGSEPNLSDITNPTAQKNYRPVSLPMPAAQERYDNPNSLWRTGAKAFFKDIRAKDVGDILTVRLAVDDVAKLKNKTNRARGDGENDQVNTVLGVNNPLSLFINEANNGGTVLEYNSKLGTLGDGKIERQEEISTAIAAVVTQVLPNGSLAIVGRQEIRVDYELREVAVQGVVRPSDIEADNSIAQNKIAELRFAYGGRGTLSDLQQPRWGTQLWDILYPF